MPARRSASSTPRAGDEVVAIYAGPMIVRQDRARHAPRPCRSEIVVATGAAEIHPVCPGNRLAGLVTARAAERARAPPAWTWAVSSTVGADLRPTSKATNGRVPAVVTADGDDDTECDTVDRRPRARARATCSPGWPARCR